MVLALLNYILVEEYCTLYMYYVKLLIEHRVDKNDRYMCQVDKSGGYIYKSYRTAQNFDGGKV